MFGFALNSGACWAVCLIVREVRVIATVSLAAIQTSVLPLAGPWVSGAHAVPMVHCSLTAVWQPHTHTPTHTHQHTHQHTHTHTPTYTPTHTPTHTHQHTHQHTHTNTHTHTHPNTHRHTYTHTPTHTHTFLVLSSLNGLQYKLFKPRLQHCIHAEHLGGSTPVEWPVALSRRLIHQQRLKPDCTQRWGAASTAGPVRTSKNQTPHTHTHT